MINSLKLAVKPGQLRVTTNPLSFIKDVPFLVTEIKGNTTHYKYVCTNKLDLWGLITVDQIFNKPTEIVFVNSKILVDSLEE